MIRIPTLIGAFLLTISGSLLWVPHASAITVKVSINGQVSTCSANPCDIKDFPGEAGFTIESGQVSWTDGGEDNLDLSNLEVTASANDATGTIIFWADDFASGPDASPANAKGFYHKAKGALTNGDGTRAATTNSWVKLTGSLNDDVIVGTYTKTVLCGPLPASCGNFNISPHQKETWFSLSGNRKMQGKLEFLLRTNGHKLKLNDSSIPQSIYSGAPARAGKKTREEVLAEVDERLGEDRPRPERSKRDCEVSAPVSEGTCQH